MRFKLFFLVTLLIHSCTNYNKEAISLFNFLPTDSKVIISINDLNNTKEILNKNGLLPVVLSTSNEISNQLGLLSNNNSDRKGLFSLSTYVLSSRFRFKFTYPIKVFTRLCTIVDITLNTKSVKLLPF